MLHLVIKALPVRKQATEPVRAVFLSEHVYIYKR